ncbi:MAG: hypothetical protein AAFO94_22200, partial [Bacteroidota bacterium]
MRHLLPTFLLFCFVILVSSCQKEENLFNTINEAALSDETNRAETYDPVDIMREQADSEDNDSENGSEAVDVDFTENENGITKTHASWRNVPMENKDGENRTDEMND